MVYLVMPRRRQHEDPTTRGDNDDSPPPPSTNDGDRTSLPPQWPPVPTTTDGDVPNQINHLCQQPHKVVDVSRQWSIQACHVNIGFQGTPMPPSLDYDDAPQSSPFTNDGNCLPQPQPKNNNRPRVPTTHGW